SGSFISKPISDSLIQLPAMASGASLAGTCLMQTMVFMLILGATKTHGLVLLTAQSSRCLSGHRLKSVLQGYLPSQRLKIRAAFVPPKPNELERAYSTEAPRAVLGT